MPSAKIFAHARRSAVIADPHGILRGRAESGAFSLPASAPKESAAVLAALEVQGRMPVARGGEWGGVQVAVGALGLGLALFGGFLLAFGDAPLLLGLALFVVGSLLAGVAWASARNRMRNLQCLNEAWRAGWLRFAPARVGAVWISSSTEHSAAHGRAREVRYHYRAAVQVPAFGGREGFEFTTEEFSLNSDRDGKPIGVHLADSHLDVFEPEYFNGWTIARWVAGHPENATITTDLSSRQVAAAIEAAGV